MDEFLKRMMFAGWLLTMLCFMTGCMGGAYSHREETVVSNSEESLPEDKPALENIASPMPDSTPVLSVPEPPLQVDRKSVADLDRLRVSGVSNARGANRPAPVAKEKTKPRKGRNVVPPPAPSPADVDSASGIVLNFDDADLYEVIRTLADMLGFNYLVDANVGGKVTIHTAGKLSKAQLFPVFYHILDVNGLTAVRAEDGNLFKIMKIKDAARAPIISHEGASEDGLPSIAQGDRMVIQIISLKYISAQEMSKLLTPFISATGTIVEHEASNALLVVDKVTNIGKVLKMVDSFDIDLFDRVYHRFYEVRYTDVEKMVPLLNEVLGAYGGSAKQTIRLLPIARLNTLLVISQNQNAFETIEGLIDQLDVASHTSTPSIFVYSVRNGQAEELGTLLNDVFNGRTRKDARKAGSEKKESDEKRPVANVFAKKEAVSIPAGAETGQKGTASIGSGTLRGEVQITPDTVRNALIIEAYPSDYKIIETVLSRLDVLPRQVLIEVTIAEITLDESTKLGIEWTYVKGKGRLDTSLLSATLGDAGLGYVIGMTDRWKNTLTALATENKVNVISSPSILASDNKQASINVSTEVPIASAEYQFDSGNNGVLQTNIQYRNTGVILTVTPHINEFGLVNMTVSQEVSTVSGGVDVGGKTYPSFKKRLVTTDLTVNSSQTIVMGGLMTDERENVDNGVPLLSRVPFLGAMFGTKNKLNSKLELILLITPRVVTSLEDVDVISTEFKTRVEKEKGRF
ncbi:MAG: type II secretion system secretin GspD [Pseudomonadota bacterium]